MTRLFKSFRWAGHGLLYCVRNEKNFQLHCVSTLLVIFLGFYFSISHIEWMVLVVCIGAVLALEMVNTAIEQLCNQVTKAIDPRIRTIKDVAAGAVLSIAMVAAICGAIIFIPKILALL